MPLDIGIGIFLSLLTHVLFDIPISGVLLCAGIVFALLPDIDIVTALFGKWRHREITHYPLLYIPFIILAFMYAPFPYAVLFALGITAHFIHDTIGIGWGIAWLWPFTSRRFLILPDGERRAYMGAVATWLPHEKPEWRHTGGHAWVRNFYFRPNPIAYIEYGSLLIALVVLVMLIIR